ncbi:hypothetical protein CAL7102_08663 [Dulcicalothrix desertica PCC 7102]|nr:hypothetical protein CAL7102_08663 [Dulcicalothrix desertica PCC 7102]
MFFDPQDVESKIIVINPPFLRGLGDLIIS